LKHADASHIYAFHVERKIKNSLILQTSFQQPVYDYISLLFILGSRLLAFAFI